MAKIFPVVKKVGGAPPPPAGGDATGVWEETAQVQDGLTVSDILSEDLVSEDALASVFSALIEDSTIEDIWSVGILSSTFEEESPIADEIQAHTELTETFPVSDNFQIQTSLPEDSQVADEIQSLFTSPAEDSQVNDLTQIVISSVDVARSGTPDNDPMFDTWTDQAGANNNHGGELLSVKGKHTVGNNERRGYVAIDLTWASDFSAVGTGFTYTFIVSHDGIGTINLFYDVRRSVAKPFTESTATWNAPPALGNQIATGQIGVAAGAGSVKTITIPAVDVDPALGEWILIVFTAASFVTTNIFTILSRDHLTASERPKWALDAIQRGT